MTDEEKLSIAIEALKNIAADEFYDSQGHAAETLGKMLVPGYRKFASLEDLTIEEKKERYEKEIAELQTFVDEDEEELEFFSEKSGSVGIVQDSLRREIENNKNKISEYKDKLNALLH